MTIIELGVVKPALFCAGAVALVVAAVGTVAWLVFTDVDPDIDLGDDDDVPSLLPNLRGVT